MIFYSHQNAIIKMRHFDTTILSDKLTAFYLTYKVTKKISDEIENHATGRTQKGRNYYDEQTNF